MRVDLSDPDIRLFTTPRIEEDYQENFRETAGLTVSDFQAAYGLQAVINANFFRPGTYYLPAGTPMTIKGLAISEGEVVSSGDDDEHTATMTFDAENNATFIPDNWPVESTEAVYTAVAGNYPLLVNGENVAPTGRGVDDEPRTVFGLSEDRRYLYLVCIDGRQPGYSQGAWDTESAEVLRLLGAHDGMNVDGGGSTTLVIEETTGFPLRLNRSSAVADSGRERTVGSHLGLYAERLPGFFNEVTASPGDTSARITWSTVEHATSEIIYGEDREPLDATSGFQPE
jgi:hypothetical protein